MLPASFTARRPLALLNTLGVGFSLSTAVAGVLGLVFHNSGLAVLASGLSTFVAGTAWAALLRWRKTVGNSPIRVGWVASVPLAILNATVAAAMLFGLDRPYPNLGRFVEGAFLGATFGALIWLPALLATLAFFGAPIAWAQRLAKQGLAGEERGEWIVGLVCTWMSAAGMGLSLLVTGRPYDHFFPLAQLAVRTFGSFGLVLGLSAVALAVAREARRRRFVRDVEDGKVKGYRIDATDEGKVLLRVTSQGAGYRVADFEEELFELDEQGEARRPKEMVLERER